MMRSRSAWNVFKNRKATNHMLPDASATVLLTTHFFLSAMVLAAVWYGAAALLTRLVGLHSPAARVLVFSVPLIAAFGARIRLSPDAVWEIVGVSLVVAGTLFSADVFRYRRFIRTLAQDLHPAPALQAVVDALAPHFGLRTPPRAYESNTVGGGPCVVGLWRPVVVVPRPVAACMDADELRALVAHELAHVRRRDGLWKWTLQFLRRLAFLNPVAWAVHRRIGLEVERACDLHAVYVTGQPGVLARTLVKVSDIVSRPAEPAGRWDMANVPRAGSQLAHRIGAIAGYCEQSRPQGWRNFVKTTVVFGAFAMLCLQPGRVLLAITGWAG